MGRHIRDTEVGQRLRAGRTIEQWLPVRLVDGKKAIGWLTLEAARSACLRVHRVWDEGDEEKLDLYGFSPVDASEARGEGVERPCDGISAALAAAAELGASADRWVNAGLLQDEYADWIRAGRPT